MLLKGMLMNMYVIISLKSVVGIFTNIQKNFHQYTSSTYSKNLVISEFLFAVVINFTAIFEKLFKKLIFAKSQSLALTSFRTPKTSKFNLQILYTGNAIIIPFVIR